MLGKSKWFKRRKYGGWGITPQTWQGWVYIIIIIVPFAIFQSLPYWSNEIRMYVTGGWILFLLLDVTHIMFTLDKDEREEKIESMSERNAAWFMVLILLIGTLYRIIKSGLVEKVEVDWFVLTALFGGALVKTLSNIYYERKN